MRTAVQKRAARKERAWIYCRVDAPDAFAVKMQQSALNDLAEKHLLEVVGTTAEQGSGLSLMRDGIAEISHAAEQRQMDVLLMANISRLGRNALEVREYVRWLKNLDVRVVCMSGPM